MFFMILGVSVLDLTNLSKKNKVQLGLLITILLILISGIRWETGNDWDLYYQFFINNSNIDDYMNDPENLESVYCLWNYIVKLISDKYTVFLFFTATIVILLKFRWIYKYTSFPLIAIMINFSIYFGDVFFVRQTLALVITLYAFDFIVQRNLSKFILCMLIATMVHTSAVIFIPAYWIYKIKFSTKKIIFIILACVFVGLLENFLLELLLNMFDYGDGRIFMKLHAYVMRADDPTENYGQELSNTSRYIFTFLRRIIILPLLLYLKDDISQKYSIFNGTLNFVITANIIFAMISVISLEVAARFSYYYQIYEILLLTSIFMVTNKIKYKIGIFVLIGFYSGVRYILSIYAAQDTIIPFKIFF